MVPSVLSVLSVLPSFILSILCRSPAKMDLYLESYDGPSGVHLRDNLPHCNIQNGQNVVFIFIFCCHKFS